MSRTTAGILVVLGAALAVASPARAQQANPPVPLFPNERPMLFTLTRGAQVIGTRVGEDAETWTVLTATGLVRIRKIDIASMAYRTSTLRERIADVPQSPSPPIVQPGMAPPPPVVQPGMAPPPPIVQPGMAPPPPIVQPGTAPPVIVQPGMVPPPPVVQQTPPVPPPPAVEPTTPRRKSALRVGIASFSITYGLTAGIGAIASIGDPDANWLLVPVAGPLLYYQAGDLDDAALGVLILATVLQAASLAALIVGIATAGSGSGASARATPSRVPRLALTPVLAPSWQGAALSLRL